MTDNPFAQQVEAALRARLAAAAADLNALADQPPPAGITAQRTAESLRILIPPAPPRPRSFSPPRLALGFLLALVLLSPLSFIFGGGAVFLFLFVFVPLTGLLGSLLWWAQARWERIELIASPDRLTILQRCLIWTDSDTVRRDQIAGIGVGMSCMSVPRDLMLELKITLASRGASGLGPPARVLLEGRTQAELDWIAATLRRAMDAPAATAMRF